jgi:hypothetical protein
MRRILFSIPALVLACATSSPKQQRSGTEQAQADAQKQYQDAATAQKRAGEEQQKAEQAEREVIKAQKALADAQATLAGQRAKAAQAQRDAYQSGRDSQERGAQMQQRAAQLQGDEARQETQTEQGNQRAWMQTRNVDGTVAAVTPSSLTIRSEDQGDVLLHLGDSTAVNLDGRASSMKEIRVGSDVRASYGRVDGLATAVRLDLTSNRSKSDDSSSTTAK